MSGEHEAPPGAPVEEARKHPLRFLVRIVVGVAVFGILVARSDPAELAREVRGADPLWFGLAAFALFCGIGISALRWRAYLDALELHLPWGTLYRLYFVGTFFNAFLPTGIGGDAYKAVRIGQGMSSLAPAFASVFLDRFAGVMALALVGFSGALAELVSGDPDLQVAGLAAAIALAILASGVTLLLAGERLLGRGRLIRDEGIGGRLRRAVRAVHEAGRHPPAAARGYLYGLVFQGLVLTYHLSVARALEIDGVSAGAMAGIVVIASIATMIPLSINGLGFREGAYVWALGVFGVARLQATAFAALILVILLLTSAVGGIVYLVAGGEVRRR